MHNLFIGIYNDSFLDSYWVAVHFAAGLIAGLAIIQYLRYRTGRISTLSYWRYGIVVILLWEYFEMSLRYIQKYDIELEVYLQTLIPDSFFQWESITNIVSDLFFGALGLLLLYFYVSRDQES